MFSVICFIFLYVYILHVTSVFDLLNISCRAIGITTNQSEKYQRHLSAKSIFFSF